MSKYATTVPSVTPTATADATNLADSTYAFAINGGSATMEIKYSEVNVQGEAPSASTPTLWRFGRDSQVATGTITATTTRTGVIDASSVAPGTLPSIIQTAATNKPQRSATLGHLIILSMNAYGGVLRWVARQGEEIKSVGNTASLGEMSLSAFTGGTPGPCSLGVIYEVV